MTLHDPPQYGRIELAKKYETTFRRYADATPSRTQILADFVQWARTTPGVLDQRPADGLTTYLVKIFPCPRGK